jgi:hypothetical protein
MIEREYVQVGGLLVIVAEQEAVDAAALAL